MWIEKKTFPGTGVLILAEYKTAEKCKIFKLSLTAAKLGQILHFKGF